MDISPLLNASLAIQLHVIGVLVAIIATALIFTHPRGRGRHKIYGWAWVLGMALAAVSSFFIHSINDDGFSPIHILSALVVYGLIEGIYAIRFRRNIKGHRSAMLGMTIGGLGIAGVLSFLPGRIMSAMFLGL